MDEEVEVGPYIDKIVYEVKRPVLYTDRRGRERLSDGWVHAWLWDFEVGRVSFAETTLEGRPILKTTQFSVRRQFRGRHIARNLLAKGLNVEYPEMPIYTSGYRPTVSGLRLLKSLERDALITILSPEGRVAPDEPEDAWSVEIWSPPNCIEEDSKEAGS